MTEPRRFGVAEFVLVVLVVAGAAGARAWYLWACADSGNRPGPLQVQGARPPLALPPLGPNEEMRGKARPNELDALAHNWQKHNWFGGLAPLAPAEEQTAHVAPGYPWLLSRPGAWLGRSPAEADHDVRWGQAVLGALTAGLYFLFALRAFNSLLVAALTGGLCAVYPFWVANTAEIDDGVLATFLLALCLWLGARGGQDGGPFTSYLYGAGLAGLALVRAALLPFAFVAALWFLWRCRRLQRGWLYALLAFFGFATGLVPWGLRNGQYLRDVVPVADSAYLHLWAGNNPRADGGPMTEAALLEALPEARRQEVAKAPDQKARYAVLGRAFWDQVREGPAGTLRRRLSAGVGFFLGADWFRADGKVWRAETESMPAWLERSHAALLYGSLLGALALGALGWRWTYGWRFESMPAALAVLWVPLPYVLSHAEALHGPRLPLDGVFLCYAAFAAVCLIPTVGSGLLDGSEDGPA